MMTDKRTDILNATLRLISENGFHGTPMSMIAEEADVGAGTIYRYFDSKEALIDELYLDVKREISQAMMEGFTLDTSTEESFKRVWFNTYEFCVQNPQKMIFLEQFQNSPFQTLETEAATQEFMAPIFSAIQAVVETGEIKNMPFEIMSIFVHDVTVALAKRQISGALVMDQANLELAAQACWDAVKMK
jgi:AcrR family transcriptional regulator